MTASAQSSFTEGTSDVNPECYLEDRCEDINISKGAGDSQPLLAFFDCETTGFSIYNDHITDLGVKVVASPVPLSEPTFSSQNS